MWSWVESGRRRVQVQSFLYEQEANPVLVPDPVATRAGVEPHSICYCTELEWRNLSRFPVSRENARNPNVTVQSSVPSFDAGRCTLEYLVSYRFQKQSCTSKSRNGFNQFKNLTTNHLNRIHHELFELVSYSIMSSHFYDVSVHRFVEYGFSFHIYIVEYGCIISRLIYLCLFVRWFQFCNYGIYNYKNW